MMKVLDRSNLCSVKNFGAPDISIVTVENEHHQRNSWHVVAVIQQNKENSRDKDFP
jgi:hypothetical protein